MQAGRKHPHILWPHLKHACRFFFGKQACQSALNITVSECQPVVSPYAPPTLSGPCLSSSLVYITSVFLANRMCWGGTMTATASAGAHGSMEFPRRSFTKHQSVVQRWWELPKAGDQTVTAPGVASGRRMVKEGRNTADGGRVLHKEKHIQKCFEIYFCNSATFPH